MTKCEPTLNCKEGLLEMGCMQMKDHYLKVDVGQMWKEKKKK